MEGFLKTWSCEEIAGQFQWLAPGFWLVRAGRPLLHLSGSVFAYTYKMLASAGRPAAEGQNPVAQWELLQLICLGSGGQHVQRPPPRGMGRPIGL